MPERMGYISAGKGIAMLTKDGILEALVTYEGRPLLICSRHPAWIACHAFMARLPPALLQGSRFDFQEEGYFGERLDWYLNKESRRGEATEEPTLRTAKTRIYIPAAGGKKIKMQEKYAALLDGYRLEVLQFDRSNPSPPGHPIGAFNDRGDLVLAVMPLRR